MVFGTLNSSFKVFHTGFIDGGLIDLDVFWK